MTFNELIENVKGWSTAKELDKASPLSQMLKLNEEWGELNSATVRVDGVFVKTADLEEGKDV